MIRGAFTGLWRRTVARYVAIQRILVSPVLGGEGSIPVESGWVEQQQLISTESTHKGVNQCSKYVTQVQQQRPESPMVTLTWHRCKYKVPELHQRYVLAFYFIFLLLFFSLIGLFLVLHHNK